MKEQDKQILVDPALHQAIKVQAAKEYLSMRAWVIKVLRAEVEKVK